MVASGARTGRRVLIALVILVVLLVVADRVSDYVAEQAAANTIESSQHLSAKPDVSIGGFPFLTQLATGEFGEITVTAKDVPVGDTGRRLDVSRVRVVLHHLTASRSFQRFTAASASATALVTYADLGRTLGIGLSYAGDGRVRASKKVSVAGHSFTAMLTARPTLVHDALSFAAVTVSDLGAVGAALAKTLTEVFDLSIPLTSIPFDVRVQRLEVDASGLVVDLAGNNLTYARG